MPSKPIRDELVPSASDPERIALQCRGEVHGFLIAHRWLRFRCRARDCRAGGPPVFHDIDLTALYDRLGFELVPKKGNDDGIR